MVDFNVRFPDEARNIVHELAYSSNVSLSQIMRNIVCTELVKHAKTERERGVLLKAIKKTNSE